MSAIGRLWRRAPAWRFCACLGLASTCLVAMFPSPLPAFRFNSLPGAASGPRYTPQPDPAPLRYGSIDLPPITQTRSGIIPFAGRQLPLPEGRWSELVLMRSGGLQMLQALVLVRLQAARMTGMIIVAGTPALAPRLPPAMQPRPCINLAGIAMHDLSPPDDPCGARQECWSVRRLATAPLAASGSPSPLEQRAFARLGKLDMEVPTYVLAAHYVRTDGGGTLAVTILLPDPARSSAVMRHTESWMQRWVMLLHRGFDGALTPSSVSPALARDPASSFGSP